MEKLLIGKNFEYRNREKFTYDLSPALGGWQFSTEAASRAAVTLTEVFLFKDDGAFIEGGEITRYRKSLFTNYRNLNSKNTLYITNIKIGYLWETDLPAFHFYIKKINRTTRVITEVLDISHAELSTTGSRDQYEHTTQYEINDLDTYAYFAVLRIDASAVTPADDCIIYEVFMDILHKNEETLHAVKL